MCVPAPSVPAGRGRLAFGGRTKRPHARSSTRPWPNVLRARTGAAGWFAGRGTSRSTVGAGTTSGRIDGMNAFRNRPGMLAQGIPDVVGSTTGTCQVPVASPEFGAAKASADSRAAPAGATAPRRITTRPVPACTRWRIAV